MKTVTFTFLFLLTQLCISQTVDIPDPMFKAALLDHGVGITGPSISVIDINGDSEIQVSEATAYTGGIVAAFSGANNLIGIEAFINITELSCEYNNLTTLDLSNNLALTYLSCGENDFTSLNLSEHTNLIEFECVSGALTVLNVANGNNSSIEYLDVTDNPDLTCIQHDSEFDPLTNPDWYKDDLANWSDNCSPSSIEETQNDFLIYPNPTEGELNIQINSTIFLIEIFSMTGEKINSYQGKSDLDVSLLDNGVYFLNLYTDKGTITQKIIKK